jgi:hypothetical protein
VRQLARALKASHDKLPGVAVRGREANLRGIPAKRRDSDTSCLGPAYPMSPRSRVRRPAPPGDSNAGCRRAGRPGSTGGPRCNGLLIRGRIGPVAGRHIATHMNAAHTFDVKGSHKCTTGNQCAHQPSRYPGYSRASSSAGRRAAGQSRSGGTQLAAPRRSTGLTAPAHSMQAPAASERKYGPRRPGSTS